jgi:hypothetical protein
MRQITAPNEANHVLIHGKTEADMMQNARFSDVKLHLRKQEKR